MVERTAGTHSDCDRREKREEGERERRNPENEADSSQS
jgi:hypothetical protein